jgi:hypothetical protein
MKKFFRFFPMAILSLFLSTAVWGQTSHKMYLSAPTTTTYLNEIISGDTTSAGARADSERVYVLERGGTWFFNNTIYNPGWTLDIEADTGSGALPKIYNLFADGSNPSAIAYNTVSAQGSVVFKNIFFDGYLDLDTSYFSTYGAPTIVVNFSSAGYSLYVEGCRFVNTGQSFFTVFAAATKITLIDNIFGNYGLLPTFNTGVGRILDIRNTSCDSVIIRNNTMIMGMDRVFRHLASVGRLNNFIFEHNTVYENGGRYGLLALGAVGNSVSIKNNLLIDPMAFGADTSFRRQSDFKEMGEYDSDGKVIMTWIFNQLTDTLSGSVATTWDIANNYWCVTSQVQAAYDSINSAGWQTSSWAGRHMSDHIKAQLTDTTNAFIEEPNFTLANVPSPMAGTVIWYIEPSDLGGADGSSSGGTVVLPDRHIGLYFLDTLDCSYSTSYAAYTGGTDGYPAGDLNWFPTKKAEWAGTATDVKTTKGTKVPTTFSLSNAYPNPFNPTTNINFTIAKSENVKLIVYNILGQKVKTLVNGSMKVGSYSATWDGKDEFGSHVASGIYFYRLESQSFNAVKKMILMK